MRFLGRRCDRGATPPRNATLPRAVALIAAAALGVVLPAACGRDERAPEAPGPAPGLDAPALEADRGAPPPLEIPADAPTVAFIGDSIGAGLHLAAHQAFPAVLERRLAAEGRPFRLLNASESGRTTAGGLRALEWVLRSHPDVVVIELGGNDGLRGLPLEEIERNLRAMIERSREAGARVLLLGVRLPENYGAYGREFDALYPRLAEELDVAFVPSFMEGVGLVPELNLRDGLHPNPAGHERLAENVAPALAALLDELGDG